MSTVYTQNLNGNGEILKQRLKGYENVADILSCRDELLLTQSVLEDNVEKYAEALESGKDSDKVIRGSMVSKQAKEVVGLKEKMVKMDQMRQQSISRDTIFVWVRNIGELLYRTFPSQSEEVTDILAQIEGGILGTTNTVVTEEDLFAEAVSTVPMIEDLEDLEEELLNEEEE